MKMKKVFRPHIILYTEGRLLCIIMIFVPLLMLCMGIKFTFFSGEINYGTIHMIVIALLFILLSGWVLEYLWQPIWGKLILDDEKITWKCLFCPKVQIEYANIKFIVVRTFGNRNAVHVDIYKTGFQFILIATQSLPNVPIDKVRCKKGLIKWAKSEAVYKALREAVPNKLPPWRFS